MARVVMASPATARAVLALVSRDRAVTDAVKAAANDVRDEARSRAGEGAKHVIAARFYDPDTRQVSYRVGWRPEHFYMGFKELGTIHQPPRPFLRPAADLFGGRASTGDSAHG